MRWFWRFVWLAVFVLVIASAFGCSGVGPVIQAHEKSDRTYCYTYRGLYGTAQLAATGIKRGVVDCRDGTMNVQSGEPLEE